MTRKDKNRQTIEAYDKNAKHYADVFDSYGVRRDDIDRALKFNTSNSKIILELGCGNGRDAKYVVSEVGVENYLGIDASTELIRLAVDKLPEVSFQPRDMRKFFASPDVSGETFGVIFAFYSMLHMEREELVHILSRCHQSLKIGGVLYVSSKYGDYREIEIENLGDKKYYYSYKSEDLESICREKSMNFETIYKVIHDSDYGPSFTIALRKVG
jgi:trans-aconitate methyltransferase